MSSPHQDSLLPRFAQGEEGHETTTKFPCLVCVDRVSHTVDIHLSDTKIAVRDSWPLSPCWHCTGMNNQTARKAVSLRERG